jgi:nucleotide-binding universal stress UspA family protein
MPPNISTGRVLVPLDGSELAEAVLPLLEGGGFPWGSEVLLARSVATSPPAESSAEMEAGNYLAVQARRLERAGLRVRCEVWHGDPSQTIVNAAVRSRVGLIAMTTHGWRGLDRLRFGSVAESVVRAARVPVLLVRGQLRWPADRPPRILVPLDGSAQSAAALTLISRIRQPLHAVVELCHVLDASLHAAYRDFPPSMVAARPEYSAAREYLDRVAARLAGTGPEVEWVVLEGPVAPTITQRIADGRVDLVAMTTHGRSGVARLLMGSVAEQVLRAANVPVLLWKAPIPPAGSHPGRVGEGAVHEH